MKKRLLAIITILAMAVAFAVPTFAANGISAKEQVLLNKFKAGVVLDDGTVVTPNPRYITQAENWLIKDDLTDEEIKLLSDTIDKLAVIVKQENFHNIYEIRVSDRYDEIVLMIQAACRKVGYIVVPKIGGESLNPEPGIKPIGDNGKGTEIDITPSTKPKQTGFDMTATVVSVIALIAVLSGSAVIINKKNLFAE